MLRCSQFGEESAALLRFRGGRGRGWHGGSRTGDGAADWLTLGQAAAYLGVAQSTIRWSDQGRLPAFYTPGGHRRYRRRDLDASHRARPTPAAPRARGTPRPHRRRRPRIREFVRVNLEMDGYVVREAGSADEGLAALEEQAPRPHPPRRDDARRGRLGDAPPHAGAPRHSIPVIMFSGQVESTDDDAQYAVRRASWASRSILRIHQRPGERLRA